MLCFIALAQLMVVLDGTVINIALPHAQEDLHFSDDSRQWVITAYALSFGSLLLLGGRIADKFGRRRALTIGLIGFATASAIGGASVNFEMLVGARALQGAFGAILAPAALSLITVIFTEGKERAKAFGIYGGISGTGAAVGLLLGGALTEYLDWRATMYVNVVFAVVTVSGAIWIIREPKGTKDPNPIDVPGVLLVASGLAAIVYGLGRASNDGWSNSITVATMVGGLVLLVVFVLVENRVAHPLLPLRVPRDRNRGGAYLTLGLAVIGMYGVFLFMTFYLQTIRGYTPMMAGVAFMPMVVGMLTGSTQIAARLTPYVAPRLLMGPGLIVAATGMLILTRIGMHTDYWTTVAPGMFLLGLGLGTTFMTATSLATMGIEPEDSGVASAMVNTSQQIGGAIGTALLNTIATGATAAYIASHAINKTAPDARTLEEQVELQGTVDGFIRGTWWGVGFLLASALIAVVLINRGKLSKDTPAGDGVPTADVPTSDVLIEDGPRDGEVQDGDDQLETARP